MFREDVYTCTLKYRKWDNELRPFQSLKRRVANIFQKQNSLSDNSKGTSTQTIINNVENEEEKSVSTNSKRDSVHSNWSELLSVDEEAEYKRICRSESIIGVDYHIYCFSWKIHEEAFHPSNEKDGEKYSVSTIYTKAIGLGKLESKISICHQQYC